MSEDKILPEGHSTPELSILRDPVARPASHPQAPPSSLRGLNGDISWLCKVLVV